MYRFNDHLSFTWYSPQFVAESFKTKLPNHGNKSCFESLGKSNTWKPCALSLTQISFIHLPLSILLSYTCCKKTRGWYGHREPKKFERSTINKPKPKTSGGFPKHKGNARTLRILVTLPQIESIRLAYHSQVDPGDPGLGRCHNTME